MVSPVAASTVVSMILPSINPPPLACYFHNPGFREVFAFPTNLLAIDFAALDIHLQLTIHEHVFKRASANSW
jgi:hypothetical protein